MSLPADNIHKHSADPVDPCAPCNFPLGAGSHFVLVHLLTCFCFCYATDTFFPIETAKPTLKTQSLCLFSFPSSAHMKLAWQQATWCLRQSGTLRGPQLPEPIPTPRTPPAATAEKTTVPWRARIKKTYTEDLWSRARACRWAAIWKERENLGISLWKRRKTQKRVMSWKSYVHMAPRRAAVKFKNSAIHFNQLSWIRSRHHILENSQQRHFTFWLTNKMWVQFSLAANKCWIIKMFDYASSAKHKIINFVD